MLLPQDPKTYLQNLTQLPGIYVMRDRQGVVLYVGKARNLRKRVASYFRRSGLPPKTQAMMRRVVDIETTKTRSESEALLLEQNLIKQHRPRYNIDLRDDKSYPYIHLDDSHEFPRLGFYRGNRSEAGRFFGPYANAGAVRETLAQLQKIFPVRQCEDTFFRSRSRPCLQYQIGRCTAPCVGLVDREDYAEDVRQAVLFLEGKDRSLAEFLMDRMEQASAQLDFETAARFRDRLRALRRIQEHQYVTGDVGDIDIVALFMEEGLACIETVFVRGGRHNGSKAFFPESSIEATPAQLMAAFLGQFYLNKAVPAEILTRPAPADRALLENMLNQRPGPRVRIRVNPRGKRARWLDMAQENAKERLKQRLAGRTNQQRQLEVLRQALDLNEVPRRIECFDVSHTAGEATVAACVVFDVRGPVKSDYRRYNIKDVVPGDDYGALANALMRRYRRVQETEGTVPDLLLIDGGKGQLTVAHEVLSELQLEGVVLMAIAKGPARKPGAERLFLLGRRQALTLAPQSPALHLIQRIRDEAHRFAITGHRQRRGRSRVRSTLEDIPGIGSKRRQALLRHLGGMQEVARAGVEDLVAVPGISPELARKIYTHLHGE